MKVKPTIHRYIAMFVHGYIEVAQWHTLEGLRSVVVRTVPYSAVVWC